MRKLFDISEQCNEAFKVIASDRIGPFRVTSLGGAQYLQTIADHGRNFISVYPIRTKEAKSVTKNIRKFLNFGQNQYGKISKPL
jgi:hypothetical protein